MSTTDTNADAAPADLKPLSIKEEGAESKVEPKTTDYEQQVKMSELERLSSEYQPTYTVWKWA
jgi:hypothetical protein